MKFVLDYTRGNCYNTFRTDYGAFGEMSEWSIVQHSKSCDWSPKVNIYTWKRIEVVVTSCTRNAVVRKGTWVRIPPLPPSKP